jgi:hypothetical protein
MKLLPSITELTIHHHIDGLVTIHIVLWKQIFSVASLISMWCGMINNLLIGPIILEYCMTGHNYLDFLQNGLPEQLQNVPLATRIAIYFQHADPLLIISGS